MSAQLHLFEGLRVIQNPLPTELPQPQHPIVGNGTLVKSLHLTISYQHAQQCHEASKASVASQDVELVPELVAHDDGEEEDDQGQQ